MATLSDLSLSIFKLVIRIYVRDTDIAEILEARTVSRTFAEALGEELLFNGAKIVNSLLKESTGMNPSVNIKAITENRFLENNAGIVLYHYVQRPPHTKPLLPIYIGAIADDLIQGTLDVVGELQYTPAEVHEIRNNIVHELCHTFVKLNPRKIWVDLARSPRGGYSRSVHKSLAIVACLGHISVMQYFLNLEADSFELVHDSFRNPFHTAACTGRVESLRLLFSSTTQKLESSSTETTAKQKAFARLQILQEAIDIALKNGNLESALLIKDFALTQCTPVYVETLYQDFMEIAIRNGHLQFLRSLLGDDETVVTENRTRSHLMAMAHIETACAMGHVELVRYFLQTNFINPTMFRSDIESPSLNLLRTTLYHRQCGMVDLSYETGATPLLQHLIAAVKSPRPKAFVMVRHLISSGLVLRKDATVICNDLAKLAFHEPGLGYSRYHCIFHRKDRVHAILFLAAELKKQRLLDIKQDLQGLFDLCEYAILCWRTTPSQPLSFIEMAKSILGWLKRKVPMFQPQSTRVLRSHTRDTN